MSDEPYMIHWLDGDVTFSNEYPDFSACREIEKVFNEGRDITDEWFDFAAEWLLAIGEEEDLENIPAIIERFFPNFRHELEEAIAEREALRKSDETAYKHYVR